MIYDGKIRRVKSGRCEIGWEILSALWFNLEIVESLKFFEFF